RPRPGLVERLGDGTSQDDCKRLVELRPCRLEQMVPLTRPGERVRDRPVTDRERERRGVPATPWLEIRVAQAREPRVARHQSRDLLEEPERDDERREGVGDRSVAPVEQPKPL